MVDTISRYDLPLVLYVHDIGATLPLFEGVKDRLARVITNSRFMAGRIGELWSIECDVVYPVPDRKAVTVGDASGTFITFFNPLPHKGLSVAHTLVTRRFRDRPFLFVEGFIDPETHGIALTRSGNLVHARRSPNVATIYLLTRTLVIPSQWEEPFGLVMIESMACGTPVIGLRRGAVPEVIVDGKTGFVVDNEDEMVRAVKKIDKIIKGKR